MGILSGSFVIDSGGPASPGSATKLTIATTGVMTLSSATASTSTSTGALVLSGASAGLGMLGNLWVGGTGNFAGQTTFQAQANWSSGSTTAYIGIVGGGQETLHVGNNNSNLRTVNITSAQNTGTSASTAFLVTGGTNAGTDLITVLHSGNTAFSSTTEATTGGVGSLTTAGGIYATKKIIGGSTISSAGPTGGNGAAEIQFGTLRTGVALAASTTTGWQINVGGTLVTLAVLSTNP